MKNLYKRFSDLTGRKARTVGVCIDVGTLTSECTIQYPGGGIERVKGSGILETRYFVYDGKLDGEAPSLTELIIEI